MKLICLWLCHSLEVNLTLRSTHRVSLTSRRLYLITPPLSLCVTKSEGSIQRMKKNSSANDSQPPPYQDKASKARVSSRARSERGLRKTSPPQRCDDPRSSSEASEDEDTESYLNKGCEEDIPSDSTAVLGPEVRSKFTPAFTWYRYFRVTWGRES